MTSELRKTPSGFDRDKLVFLDFEASGLEPGSWPIEIGLARVHRNDTVSIDNDLIRPDPTWEQDLWSPASAQVHRIPRSALDTAPEAREIASLIIRLLDGMTIVSDAPEFDGEWLRMLTATVDDDLHIPVRDFDWVLSVCCDLEGIRRAYAALDRLPQPHRAGDDAARLARAWIAGVSSG